MATVKHFEELQSWQFARETVKEIYETCKIPALREEFQIREQLCRTALSIMNHIAEGHGRGSGREFARQLELASGACAELRSTLYVLMDLELLDKNSLKSLFTNANTTHAKIVGMLRYLRNPHRAERPAVRALSFA